jgi:REP element-mobilizing transposase RayT
MGYHAQSFPRYYLDHGYREGRSTANTNIDKPEYIPTDASPLHIMHGTEPGSLAAVIQNFKSISTRKIHQYLGRGEAFAMDKINAKNIKMANAPPIQVWQRNYYERIIRDEKELDRIRLYIFENPQQWSEDPENLSLRSCIKLLNYP